MSDSESDSFAIENHIQYKNHMKNYISKKKCSYLLTDCRDKLEKSEAAVKALKTRNTLLESKLRALINKCAPKKQGCPMIPLKSHPEYIALKKAESVAKAGSQCPEVLEAQKKLEVLRNQYGKPKCECKPESIEKHPDYASLIDSCRKKIREAESRIESDMTKKMRTDIRSHPDYSYFKSYYESEIAKLKAQAKPCPPCTETTCPPLNKCTECPQCPTLNCKECPKCPKCASRKPLPQAANAGEAETLQIKSGKINVYEDQPRPFSYSNVPTINPHRRMSESGRVHYYDTMKF